MTSTAAKLRGLILHAEDIKALTNWPDPMVEDYLALIESLTTLANEVDTKQDSLKNVAIISASPYEIKDTDEVIFFDTSAGDITANLRPGVDGRQYRLINAGSSGNKVWLNPYGTEKLFGSNSSEYLADGEVFIITFNSTFGWE